jgi:geranylgeranyl diphosphate synthase type I
MGRPADLATLPPALEAVRGRVDAVLVGFLAAERRELAGFDPSAVDLVDELSRLVSAGGKRIRPAFCYWGHRTAGGTDGEPIVRAAAALELLHTFALIHDDVMDEDLERRGAPTTHVRFAKEAGEGFGWSVAVLSGDLAAVLAERLLRTSGFPAERLDAAFERFDRMRVEMAAGQYLDLRGAAREGADSTLHVAELKTGSYTVEGPLAIGAALAGASEEVEVRLQAYARPAGEAFQLRDDVLDEGEDRAHGVTAAHVNGLLTAACEALGDPGLDPVGVAVLRALAEALRLPEA